MKLLIRNLSLITLVLLSTNLYSQPNQLCTVSGLILDKESGEPIPSVNVFLDATTLGTTQIERANMK